MHRAGCRGEVRHSEFAARRSPKKSRGDPRLDQLSQDCLGLLEEHFVRVPRRHPMPMSLKQGLPPSCRSSPAMRLLAAKGDRARPLGRTRRCRRETRPYRRAPTCRPPHAASAPSYGLAIARLLMVVKQISKDIKEQEDGH